MRRLLLYGALAGLVLGVAGSPTIEQSAAGIQPTAALLTPPWHAYSVDLVPTARRGQQVVYLFQFNGVANVLRVYLVKQKGASLQRTGTAPFHLSAGQPTWLLTKLDGKGLRELKMTFRVSPTAKLGPRGVCVTVLTQAWYNGRLDDERDPYRELCQRVVRR